MKFIRLLLRFLAFIVTLAALLAALAFVPAVQTWWVERELAQQPGWQVSIGSLSARFGRVEVTDLHAEYGGAVLTLPSLQAELPLKTAIGDRKFIIQSLKAGAWTLDLSHVTALADTWARMGAASTGGTAVPATAASPVVANYPLQLVTQVLRGMLHSGNLPWDLSLDGVALEGDVLVTVLSGREPVKVHVTVTGGGLGASQEGKFLVAAAGVGLDAENQPVNVTSHGRMEVAMGAPRVLDRLAVKTDFTVSGGSLASTVVLSAGVRADRGTQEETGTFEVGTGARKFVTALAHYSGGARQVEGNWKVDVRDSDLAPFMPDRHLPSLAAVGEGDFDADRAFTRVHVRGRLTTVANHLENIAPAFGHAGEVTLAVQFDVTHGDQSLRVDHLDLSLAGARPALAVQALQPFTVDEKTGDIAATDPDHDWMQGTLQGLSLDWLPGLGEGIAFSGGDMTGEFTAQAIDGGFNLRARAPFSAHGVSVQGGGQTFARDLDVSLTFLAGYGRQGWQVQASPLTIDNAGRRVATIEAKASRSAETNHPITLAGTWNADLDALSAQPGISGLRWITGRSASGDFSASFDASMKVEGKLAVMGHDAHHTLTASVSAECDDTHQVTFHAPLKIALGSDVSDVTIEGLWIKQDAGGAINLTVSGENVALEHLRWLAAPLLSAPTAPTTRAHDLSPFWGNWAGPISFSFDRLRVGEQEIKNVRATLDVDHASIRLENGLFMLPSKGLAKAEGSLSFDPVADLPYHLKGTAAFGDVDAAALLVAAPHGSDPVVEGRFSISGSLTGAGTDAADLLARLQQEFRLTSHRGAFRLLKTSVSGVAPEAESSSVSDALGVAGSLVGKLFGRKDNPFDSGEIHLGKNTDAVINFTYRVGEILYDELSFTAVRGPDRTVHITDFVLTGPDEHLTGSGQVTYLANQPLRAQPLSLDLELGTRNGAADLLKTAGLLSSRKDNLGYTLLIQPIHLGGTLEHIDDHQWHDLLAEAAAAKPKTEGGKKGSGTAGKNPSPPKS